MGGSYFCKVRVVDNRPLGLGKVVRGRGQIEQRGGKVHAIHIMLHEDVGKRRRSTL